MRVLRRRTTQSADSRRSPGVEDEDDAEYENETCVTVPDHTIPTGTVGQVAAKSDTFPRGEPALNR